MRAFYSAPTTGLPIPLPAFGVSFAAHHLFSRTEASKLYRMVKIDRRFTVALPVQVVLDRLASMLTWQGYVPTSFDGRPTWQRVKSYTLLVALCPLQRDSRIEASVTSDANGGSIVSIRLDVKRGTDAFTSLDTQIFAGEIDDLIAWVTDLRTPTQDRRAQNRQAATWCLAIQVLLLLPVLPIAALLTEPIGFRPALLVAVAVTVVFLFIVSPRIPLPLKPVPFTGSGPIPPLGAPVVSRPTH